MSVDAKGPLEVATCLGPRPLSIAKRFCLGAVSMSMSMSMPSLGRQWREGIGHKNQPKKANGIGLKMIM